jgi:dTDP-4-dehydrorhamnose reductase
MKKILITGSSGMLGGYLAGMFDTTKYEIICTKRSTFELSEIDKIYNYITSICPDIILHLAAETDVDLCERDPSRAGLYNHLATEQIALAASECNSYLIYISTSNVFGVEGKYTYNELDIPNPINYYGRSKLFGEMVVKQNCSVNHLIIRSGWMIGGGEGKDHKFVGKIIGQIIDGANIIKAVNDKLGSITYAKHLSEFLIHSVDNHVTGTYHFASKGTISRFDIACEIAKILEFKGDLIPVQSCVFPLSAPRPFSEGIESIYLAARTEFPEPCLWKDDLKEYVETFGRI